MIEQYIFYSVLVYFFGLFISGLVSFTGKTFKNAAFLFIVSNFFGLSAALVYFLNFFGSTMVLAHFDWFFGFEPTINLLSAIFFAIISSVSALVGVYSIKYLDLYKEIYNPRTTHALMAVFVLGMQGVLLSNNSFSFLLFWEVMSIASFFLVLADKTRESTKAAFLYFIMTHLGASAILAGFLTLGNGALIFDFKNISQATGQLTPSMAALAFGLFFFGFGSKAGLVPFHVWLPEAHPQAPSNISALMSGLMLKVAVFGFIKVIFGFTNLPDWAGLLVIGVGLLSGITGALYAAIEKDIKRTLAFSSIENMGIIFTMLGSSLFLFSIDNEKSAIIAYAILIYAIFHAICHALFKTALFLSSGVVMSRVHIKNMDHMGGLAKVMPIFSFAFLVAVLSSLPLPPFGTFYGEWGLIQQIIHVLQGASIFGINATALFIVVLMMIGLIGGLAVFAMIKMFGISMLGLPRTHIEKRDEKMEKLLVLPIFILGLGVLILGIFAKSILASLMGNTEALLQQTNLITSFSSISVFMSTVFFAIIVYAIFVLLAGKKKERSYQTWDCGQPINATMEYTATAFSAPIRFFFLKLIGRVNMLESQPVVASNQWIRKYRFSLSIRSMWTEILYRPIAKALVWWAQRLKIIQSGRIQYYLLFLLFTLIITLMIAL